ncbi:MAG: RpiB/LacA/LacB family sugar-phosphate isomerase [Fimbriimonadales bacterium]
MLCLGSRIVGTELAKAIVEAFLGTPFSQNERHLRRIHKIEPSGGEISSHTD